MFYKIVGQKARGIDGPAASNIPPYNKYATLSPENPKGFVKKAEEFFRNKGLKLQFIVIDANDVGVNILGYRNKEEEKLGEELVFDNPLGQSNESTPFLICRKDENK